ncbi:MAG: S8 family serine peptidase [Nitriliruptoraceae bacterium]
MVLVPRVVVIASVTLLLAMAAPLANTSAQEEDAGSTEEEGQNAPFVSSVDDAFFPLQWYLERTDVPAAWEVTRGTPEVTVAVIDTGVDPAHRDLQGALATDLYSGTYGLDLYRGAPVPYYTAAEDWHATAITGIVAARAGDGYGIAGVAPEASVSVYKIYGSPDDLTPPVLGGGYDPAVTAIRAATADGADVILLPWGGQDRSLALRSAISSSGVPVVVAAGNDGVDLSDPDAPLDRYPAMLRLSNLVTVTASDRDDQPWADDQGAANVGLRHVDIAAPGDRIVAPWAGQDHRYHAGTSFAAPQVAGALALAISVAPRADPARLVAELSRTARPVAAFADQVTSGGVLDVAAFLTAVQRPVCGEGLPPAGYLDVNPSSTHASSIDCITYYEVARGLSPEVFDPAGTVTRGQMASFLARTLARAGALPDPDTLPAPTEGDQASFDDTLGSAHAAAIEALAELDIARGEGDRTFSPASPVDRGQMAAFLVRTVEHLTGETYAAPRDWFDDTAGTAHELPIGIVRELGITFGTVEPRRYEPTGTVNRAQMAAFLARTLDALEREGVEVALPSG